jgi:hypothetical protein
VTKIEQLEAGWADFASKVIPAGAPEVQRREMKRAFFAGAFASIKGVILTLDETARETSRAHDRCRADQVHERLVDEERRRAT